MTGRHHGKGPLAVEGPLTDSSARPPRFRCPAGDGASGRRPACGRRHGDRIHVVHAYAPPRAPAVDRAAPPVTDGAGNRLREGPSGTGGPRGAGVSRRAEEYPVVVGRRGEARAGGEDQPPGVHPGRDGGIGGIGTGRQFGTGLGGHVAVDGTGVHGAAGAAPVTGRPGRTGAGGHAGHRRVGGAAADVDERGARADRGIDGPGGVHTDPHAGRRRFGGDRQHAAPRAGHRARAGGCRRGRVGGRRERLSGSGSGAPDGQADGPGRLSNRASPAAVLEAGTW